MTPPQGTPTPIPARQSASGLFRLSPLPDLPPTTHPAWGELIRNPHCHEFKYAAAGMLIFNLNLQWKRDPSKLGALVKQAHEFFRKYQVLLTNDLGKLFK